jgi:hypothetical protein
MRRQWFTIIGAGLCISLVPACSPLPRQDPSNDLSVSPTAQREKPAAPPQEPRPTSASHTDSPYAAITPASARQIVLEPTRNPATVTNPELIPPVAEPSAVVKVSPPIEQGADTGFHPDNKSKQPDDPPLLAAVRCLLNKQPADAAAWLASYDKPTQELLVGLLPLVVRLSESGWERCDARQASALLKQLDRVERPLLNRAPLKIKKMRFCPSGSFVNIDGYGRYQALPDSHCFRPGDFVRVYVELENLWDRPQGNDYSVHLASSLIIYDLNGQVGYVSRFPSDPGPDFSHSERHDFYRIYNFRFPSSLRSGLYTLYLQVTDLTTERTATHTLDFRVLSSYGKSER